ncbi:MAG TPA: type VI secretion system protein TssL, long form [Burkholderiaceae bacterium]|nr:type VI secretion system protein TssL, long form [Burkholderiaceae bacterium]
MSADDRTVIIDPDRTLLIPRPGGRASPTKIARTESPTTSPGTTLQHLVAGINPLLVAAGPLLALQAQLRVTTAHHDRPGLQRQLLGLIAEFEESARAAGVGRPQVIAARYLLCTFIDEAIAATPWGANPPPGTKGLLHEFHDEESGADKVFELLERLQSDAQANAALIELFYVCIALGLQGRYASLPNGRAELDALAQRLYEQVRPSLLPTDARTLSQHWVGVTRRGPTLTFVPLWIAVVIGAALVLAVVMWMSTRLSRQSEPLLRQLHEVHTSLAMPAPKAALAAKPRLAPLLAGDVKAGAIEVSDEAQRSVITLSADALFEPGTAQLQPQQLDRLRRIAQALSGLTGRIEVMGHTDDQPVQSLRFPSNWHFSRERAQAVAAALVEAGLPATRVRAEGRAETEPRVPNDSPAGRARNRRVEVLLLLPRPEG